ncbi:MAG: TIGR00270 family protein [Euryarchaeota archaeon]|nr:TIGR00270 family protein [Euryarchaeota archaeon]
MRCEVCGKEVRGKTVHVKIEGTVMKTCPGCARFGTRLPPGVGEGRAGGRGRPRKSIPYSREEKVIEFVEDVDRVIREGREAAGLTREELGRKLNEKVSVINRLESGRMVPDKKLAKKLEKALGIRLLTEVKEEKVGFSAGLGKEMTLGDFIKVKKR